MSDKLRTACRKSSVSFLTKNFLSGISLFYLFFRFVFLSERYAEGGYMECQDHV